MPNFKPYDYNQTAMVVINFEEQLQPNTFEYTLHHLISNRLDLSAFHDKYKNEKGGRSAYDPAVLLKIILFAYSKGITSSREIMWSCETNIIFKALSCDSVPHYTTIASFVSSYPDAIEALFEQVLLVCYQEGLLGNELFAVDGCKMPSNAAKEWSGTFKELKQKREKIAKQLKHCIKEHKKCDRRRSDEKERAKRLAQSINTLDKAHDKINQFLKTESPRQGQGKQQKEVKSNITDNESCKVKTNKGVIQGYNGVAAVDKKHQVIIDAQAFGEGQEYHTLKPVLESISDRYQRIGISDDIYGDDVIVTADTGFSNEENNRYLMEEKINSYIPDNQFRSRDPRYKHQKDKYGKRHQDTKVGVKDVIPSSEFTFNLKKKSCICPAGNALSLRDEKNVSGAKVKLCFEGKLSDCRHCALKQQCMRNPTSADHRKGNGRQVSKTFTVKPTATDWMKKRVDSAYGKQVYSHRMSVVEPVFGNIGTNKGLNRFSLRSKAKVQGQWRLFCMVHNIEKVMRYGEMEQERAKKAA
ncbi:transposase [Dasania marina]|uniref:transposase n=1 Tax=Dasania marina TaxID=471499 RepID=UPI0030DB7438|tara:strand:+ start:35575 stop:37155 length:1581 start_codon:yes stop_codon:yes gene_type:complete